VSVFVALGLRGVDARLHRSLAFSRQRTSVGQSQCGIFAQRFTHHLAVQAVEHHPRLRPGRAHAQAEARIPVVPVFHAGGGGTDVFYKYGGEFLGWHAVDAFGGSGRMGCTVGCNLAVKPRYGMFSGLRQKISKVLKYKGKVCAGVFWRYGTLKACQGQGREFDSLRPLQN